MSSQALSALLQELAATPRPAEAWERPLAPGDVIGRFELVRELGRGGFGVVYEARDRELGRSVAFKAVRPGRATAGAPADPAATPGGVAAEQLLREAEAIARLSHPNLVTLYDVGRCDQGPYLVLELLRGTTLKERLTHGPLPVAEALRIAAEVCRGLAHAHGQGIVHRDLKPSNVFLCEGGLVKVLDFGMAHAFGRTRLSGGTPAYMAPEQWRGAPEDERTDVFALGVMIYEMLAGELPFPDGGKSVETGRRPPELRVPDAPAVGSLIDRMLERDPVDRPRDAGEVLPALCAFLDELHRTGTTGQTAWIERRRSPWIGIAALLAAGVLVGAGVVAVVHRSEPERAAREATPCLAVLPFTTLSSSMDDAYFADGIHGELITQLTKIAGLRVIARSSVQPYRSPTRDLRAIASALGATTLLEGTVQRAGGRVRIAAQLVDPRTGQELWADRFDRNADDVFGIQTEVALEIARTLGTRLTDSERSLVARVPTRDREAHDLFLRGRQLWERNIDNESEDGQAHELLARAVAKDPAFALAIAWLARVEANHDDCTAAREHAKRALALEPDLPDAHAALGEIRWGCDRDPAGAIHAYEDAVRGAPGEALFRIDLGILRTAVGQQEQGFADLRLALTLDPRSYLVATEVAREFAFARHFDEAERATRRALEISPGDPQALTVAALIPLFRDGDLGPARAALDALPRVLPNGGGGALSVHQLLMEVPDRTLEAIAAGRVPDPFSSSPLVPRAFIEACAHASLGHADQARAAFAASLRPLEVRVGAVPYDAIQRIVLARAYAGVGRSDDAMREAHRAIDLYAEPQRKALLARQFAEVALAAGRRDEAVEALAVALRRNDALVTAASLRADPRFAALRADSRFQTVLAAAPQGEKR